MVKREGEIKGIVRKSVNVGTQRIFCHYLDSSGIEKEKTGKEVYHDRGRTEERPFDRAGC